MNKTKIDWCDSTWNTDNRACQTCKHQTEEQETVYNQYHGGNPGSTDYDVKYWWCEHFEKVIDRFVENDDIEMDPQMNCEFWEGKEDV